MRAASLPLLLLLALFGATACVAPAQTEGQRRLGELVESLQDLARQLQESRAELVAAVVDHDVLVGMRDPDLLARYRSFERHLATCEARQPRLAERAEEVAEAATAYFGHWEQELAVIASEPLREQSAKRLRKTRRQYEDLRDEVGGVIERFAPLLATLRDHATYLGVDLNAESLSGLRVELGAMQGAAAQLYRAVDEASIATHAFTGAVRT
jgi:chromosome segregation ATPase